MHKPLLAIPLAIAAGAAVLILDPVGWYTFKFDDSDMRDAVEGQWEVKVGDGAQAQTFKVEITQSGTPARSSNRGLVRSADACGSRSFVRNAGACIDSSEMMLHVAVLDVSPEPWSWGSLSVSGLHFKKGHFRIQIGDVHHRVVDVGAVIESDGTVISVDGNGKAAALRRLTAPQ